MKDIGQIAGNCVMVSASQFESRPLDTLDLNQVYKGDPCTRFAPLKKGRGVTAHPYQLCPVSQNLVGKIELEKASGKATGAD